MLSCPATPNPGRPTPYEGRSTDQMYGLPFEIEWMLKNVWKEVGGPQWVKGSSNIITMTSQWPLWRLKSPASRLFTQSFIQTQNKENIKAPRHWPLCGEFTGYRWIPRTNGQLRGKCFHLMTSSWLGNYWLLSSHLTFYRPFKCLLSRLFGHRSKITITSKLCITGHCEGNPRMTGWFSSQRASNTENAFIPWHHRDMVPPLDLPGRLPCS